MNKERFHLLLATIDCLKKLVGNLKEVKGVASMRFFRINFIYADAIVVISIISYTYFFFLLFPIHDYLHK